MSSGENVKVSNGMPGEQTSLDQLISEVIAIENENRIEHDILSPDFFVGPN